MSVGERLGTSKTQDLVLLAVLALAGYVLYNVVKGAKTAGAIVGNAVDQFNQVANTLGESTVSALAKVYTAATLPPAIKPTGSVNIQPDNLILPSSQIGMMVFDSRANMAYFTYMNVLYGIAPGAYDASGNYLAQPVPDFGLTPAQTSTWEDNPASPVIMDRWG